MMILQNEPQIESTPAMRIAEWSLAKVLIIVHYAQCLILLSRIDGDAPHAS